MGCHTFSVRKVQKEIIDVSKYFRITKQIHTKKKPCSVIFRWVYHIVTDHVFSVESIVTYHRISRKQVYHITLSIYNTYCKHNFIILYVEEGSFMPLDSFNSHKNSQTFVITFDFIFNTCCVSYIFRKFIFRLNYNHDTLLCDTPNVLNAKINK